jgi:hypothetical protein
MAVYNVANKCKELANVLWLTSRVAWRALSAGMSDNLPGNRSIINRG